MDVTAGGKLVAGQATGTLTPTVWNSSARNPIQYDNLSVAIADGVLAGEQDHSITQLRPALGHCRRLLSFPVTAGAVTPGQAAGSVHYRGRVTSGERMGRVEQV